MKKTYGTMYYVNNMKESVSYYAKMLGVNPTHESNDWTEFGFENHKLCLHAKRPGETYDSSGILIFAHDGVKALHAKMKKDGIEVLGLHEIHPEAWTFHFKDNSNNEFSVYGTP